MGLKDETKLFYRNSANGKTWRNSFKKSWRGGETIEANIRDYKTFISPGICIKMDCEGYELELLQDLIQSGLIKKVKKLVFEYSFDINKKTKDFIELMKNLNQEMFTQGITENYIQKLSLYEEYPKSWFPPCKTIFCLKK